MFGINITTLHDCAKKWRLLTKRFHKIKKTRRMTITVDEDNQKHYEKLAGQKLIEGKGSLSFTNYANICLSLSSEATLEQIIDALKRRQKN